MRRIFTLGIFSSATLLFMVQPLAGKILLPVLDGSPAVWSTCMVFFQAVLLLGYPYAHLLSTRGIASLRNQNGNVTVNRNRNVNPEPSTLHPARRTAALWIALALVPSALLLGVTQHLATDVVSAPLLCVLPLALYLATFIVAFSRKRSVSAQWWGRVTPAVGMVVLLLLLGEVRYPILPVALSHLAAFTALAMLCHTRLAETRPDPSHQTAYFLCVSLGGVIGGAAVALGEILSKDFS